jgi:hypothetical protein
MSELVSLVGRKQSTLPDRFLESLSYDELQFLYQWNGDDEMFEKSVRTKHATLIASLKKHAPLPKSIYNDCLVLMKQGGTGASLKQFDLTKTAQQTGANVYYTPSQVVIKKATGEVVVEKNASIPDPSGKRRPGQVSLVMLLSAFVRVSKGKLTTVVGSEDYAKVWEKNTAFRPEFESEVIRTFQTLLSSERVWQGIHSEKTTLSKSDLLEFLWSITGILSDEKYYYLHTYVVYQFLYPFVPEVDRRKKYLFSQARYMTGSSPRVPEKSYQIVTSLVDSPVRKAIRKVGYPEVFLYLGGIENTMVYSKKGSIISALNARTKGTSIRGSDGSGMSFISAGIGYSGITTSATRREIRAVSMTGAALGVCSKVDIQLHKVTDLTIIYSSLMKHFRESDWMVIVAQGISVPQKYASKVVSHGRDGSHLVVYEPYGMSSHSVKEKADNEEHVALSVKNYMQDSSKWRPLPSHSGYSVYTTVYGDFPFLKPGETNSSAHFFKSKAPEREHYVYRFGLADQFCGIVSTIKDLKLFGMKVVLNEKIELLEEEESFHDAENESDSESEDTSTATTTSTAVSLPAPGEPSRAARVKKTYTVQLEREDKPLRRITSETEWYNEVTACNAVRAGWWCNATPQYSPVSNVLHVEHTGTDILSTLYQEDDLIPQDEGFVAKVSIPDEEVGIDYSFVGTVDEDWSDVSEEEASQDNDEDVELVLAPPEKKQKPEKRPPPPPRVPSEVRTRSSTKVVVEAIPEKKVSLSDFI